MLSTYLLHWWNHANLGHEAELKRSMRNITIVRKRASWGWSCLRELRRGFIAAMPWDSLCCAMWTQHPSVFSHRRTAGCGCPSEVGALCYRTKRTPSPGVRQGEGGIASGPAAASGPQVSELMCNHLCEMWQRCCFPPPNHPRVSLCPSSNRKHSDKRIQPHQVLILLQTCHTQKCWC